MPLAAQPLDWKCFLRFPGDLCCYRWTLPGYGEAKVGVMKGRSSWSPACLSGELCVEIGEGYGGDFWGLPISSSTSGAAAVFSRGAFP